MGLGHWDREALLERHRERLWEAERERLLLPLRPPWRVRLAQALAPEVRWEVARGG